MRLMENESLRENMGERSKEIARNYTTEIVMPKWIDILNEVTAK